MGSLQHHFNNGDASGNNGNGNGVTWRWLVGVLMSAFVVIGGWAWGETTARVLELEKIDKSRAERLATLETDARAKDWRLQAMEQRLERIELKLDAVLQRAR